MASAFDQIARFTAGIFSEGAPHASEAPANLANGPALLLYLGLIIVLALVILWNARSYQVPELAHGHTGHAAHDGAHDSLAAGHDERLAEEIAEPEPPARDDIKIIEGIGPKTEAVFWAAGIFTFQQIADTPAERLNQILDAAGLRLGDPTSWPEQARLAAEGDWEGLEQLQQRLKGGR